MINSIMWDFQLHYDTIEIMILSFINKYVNLSRGKESLFLST